MKSFCLRRYLALFPHGFLRYLVLFVRRAMMSRDGENSVFVLGGFVFGSRSME